MILATLALSGVLAQAPATSTKIESAALFKNGYAMVVRKVSVRGDGTTVADIPQAALGSFWITTTGDLKIEEVVTTQVDKTTSAKPSSFDEFLQWNIGKMVTIQSVNLGVLEGKLMHVAGDTLILDRKGQISTVPRGEVRMLTVNEGPVTSMDRKTKERVMRFKTRGTGDLLLYGLERGMTWSPAYAFDISDEKTLSMTSKATVLNDLGDVSNAELRLVTGFPNVPWATVMEPLLSGQSVDQFTQFLGSVGIPRDSFAGRREVMTQNAAPAADFGGGFAPGFSSTDLAEDLFFYKRSGVTLKKGDRAFYILFTAKSDYTHLYTVDLPDTVYNNSEYRPMPEGPSDVWHSLKLKNTSGQPLTTAPASVYKDGQLMGQDTLMYTPADAEFLVKMSKALDIRVEATEQELTRERGALRVPNTSNVYDLVTLQGTLSIRNFKNQAVKMRITKSITGEITEAEESPVITKVAKGLREVNPNSRLVWTLDLKAGEQRDVKYTSKLYLR